MDGDNCSNGFSAKPEPHALGFGSAANAPLAIPLEREPRRPIR